MKKIILILFLSVVCYLSSVNSVYAGWPFNRTAGIEGQVTDATTGKPIENVVVGCEWVKAFISPGGDVRKGFSYEVSVTDKEGKYRIPGKTSFHIFSKFSNRDISFSHPLYETKWFGASQNKDEKGDYIAVYEPDPEKGTYGRNIYEKDGIIHFDLKLLCLEEKYEKLIAEFKEKKFENEKKKIEESRKIAGSLRGFLGSYHTAFYWMVLRDKNIYFNLEETFKKWDEIAEKVFGISDMKELFMDLFNGHKKEIKDKLMGREVK